MRIKKLVSAFSALAITVTAIAGLAVTASAAEIAFSQNFTGESTDPADYGFQLSYGNGSSPSLVTMTVQNGVLHASMNNNTAGGRSGLALASFEPIGIGNEAHISYDWFLGTATGNVNGSNTTTYIADAEGNKILYFYFCGVDKGVVKVNNTELESIDIDMGIRSTTYHIDAVLNMNTKQITSLIMTNSNAQYSYTADKAIPFLTDADNVAQFGFENSTRQDWKNESYVDNINITYEAAPPTKLVKSIPKSAVNGNVVISDTTTVNEAKKYTFEKGLSSESGAKSITEVDFMLATEDSTQGLQLTNSRNAVGTFLRVQNDGVYYYAGRGKDQANTLGADINPSEWYTLKLVVDQTSGNMLVSLTNSKGETVIEPTQVGVRNIQNSNSGRYGAINVRPGDVAGYGGVTYSGTVYLANMFVYNNQVTYTYKVDGTEFATSTVIEGLAPTEPENAPTKEGFEFVKWVVDENDPTVYNATFEEVVPETTIESVPVLDDGQPVTGVKAFKATGTFSGGEQVTWNIMATINGEPKTGTETFTIPNVEAVASLGLIVDNIPDGIDVTATLSY